MKNFKPLFNLVTVFTYKNRDCLRLFKDRFSFTGGGVGLKNPIGITVERPYYLFDHILNQLLS